MKTKHFDSLETFPKLTDLLKPRKNYIKAIVITVLMSSFNIQVPAKVEASPVEVCILNDYVARELPELDITQSLLLGVGTSVNNPGDNLLSELPELDITQSLLLEN